MSNIFSAYSRVQGIINKPHFFLTLSFGLASLASDLEHLGCHTCRLFLYTCVDVNITHNSIEVLFIEEYDACGT